MKPFLPKVFLAVGGALLAVAALALALDTFATLHGGLWPVATVLTLGGFGLVLVGFRLSRPRTFRAENWLALAGGLVVGSLGCGGVGWLLWTGYGKEVRQTDEFFRDVLARGDAAVAYEAADERLRARYTKEQFLAFAEKNPHFLRRDKLGRAELWRWEEGGAVVGVAAVPWNGSYVLYTCGPEGKRQLLGISPGLEEAAPAWALRRLEQQRHKPE